MALLIFHLPTLLLNHAATLLYPLYASYKAVTAHTRRTSSVSSYNWSLHSSSPSAPTHDPAMPSSAATAELAEMEHWLIYWSICACLTLVESTFGWAWRWIPFYWECRLLFSLWLVLPRTRGATWLYVNHLHPFLQGQEESIDAVVDDVKTRMRHESKGLLAKVMGGIFAAQESAAAGDGAGGGGKTQQQQQQGWGGQPLSPRPSGSSGSSQQPQPPQNQQPTAATPFGSLLGKLAPYAAAGAATLLSKANNNAATSCSPHPHSTRAAALQTDLDLQTRALSDLRNAERIAPEPQRTLRRAQALARKRQLEQELALLNGTDERSTESGESDDVSPPATSSKGGVRNRYPSVLGESFDFLEGSDTPASAAASPRVGAAAAGTGTGEKWAGWLGRHAS